MTAVTVATELSAAIAGHERAAIATVVSTWSSSPLPVGTHMLIFDDGRIVGSVSGGCVEGDVYEAAREVLAGGAPMLRSYSVSDEASGEVGLACGGRIEVFVQPLPTRLPGLAKHVAAARPSGWAQIIAHPDPGLVGRSRVITGGDTGSSWWGGDVSRELAARLEAAEPAVIALPGVPGARIFLDVRSPAPRLVLAGISEFAVALARLGDFLGYDVTVCDARSAFLQPERFPAATLVPGWPHDYVGAEVETDQIGPRDVVLALTHDLKFDVPLLEVALRSEAGYVGAIGSRGLHAQRLDALLEHGVTAAETARLRSPIGLDLGGRTPEATALSIMSEVVATGNGASALPLADQSGPIHTRHHV